MKKRLIFWSLASAGLFLLGSCGGEEGPVVPELLPVSKPRQDYKVDATSAERFPKFADSKRRFRYVPGSAWAELNPTQFRSLNFTFGPDGAGEVYLSEIAGFVDGGLDNINRWRGQMGLPAIGPAELDGLPRKPFAGDQAVFVNLEGSFQGMGPGDAQQGYRMLGLVTNRGCQAYSLKMVGPARLLEQQESEFLAFAATLGIVPDPEAPPYAELKVGPFEFLRPCDWDYYVPESGPLTKRPLGFKLGPEGEGRAELGIIIDAVEGGPARIFNRWRQERGLDPLDDGEITALPDQVLLGSRGKWLEIVEGETAFVGVVSQLNADGHQPMTIVATLQGPSALVEQEKVLFRTFAESLRLGPVAPPTLPQ